MGKIDTHCHLYPQEYWKELLKISERNSLPVDVQRIVTYYSKKGVPCRCALEVAGPEHLVFGTDFPFQPLESIRLINESIDALGLSPADLEGVESKNVLRILLNV